MRIEDDGVYEIKKYCGICDRLMDQITDLASVDCGGHCLQCMADAGDPGCIKFLKLRADHPECSIETQVGWLFDDDPPDRDY